MKESDVLSEMPHGAALLSSEESGCYLGFQLYMIPLSYGPKSCMTAKIKHASSCMLGQKIGLL